MKTCTRSFSRLHRSLGKCFAAGVVAAFSAGCANHIEVLCQAQPNPFEKAAAFSVLPVTMSPLTVDGKSEAEYRSSKKPETVASWDEDKKAVNDVFLQSLIETAKDYSIEVSPSSSSAPFTIVPTIDAIETGYYRIPAWNAVTRIAVNVKIKDKHGTTLDEFVVKDSIAFDALFAADTGGRMRRVARVCGEETAAYLSSRVNP